MMIKEIYSQYLPYIKSRVNYFLRRRTFQDNPIVSKEDLMQEAIIWFIQTERTEGLEAALRNRLSLHRALYDAVRKAYPVSYPYGAYRKKAALRFEPIEESAGIADSAPFHSGDMEECIAERIDMERMISSLTATEQRVMNLKLRGMSQREIALALSVTESTVSHTMKRIREKTMMEYQK